MGPRLRGGDGWEIVASRADAGTDTALRAGGDGWTVVASPAAAVALPGVDHLLVEGGAATAAAFLRADLVDRLLLYRAPILIGEGRPALDAIGLDALPHAHGRWALHDARRFGIDRLEIYERRR